jgi:tetratricopeptide (TPR) repeat protein
MNRFSRLAVALPLFAASAAFAGDLEDGKALQQAGKFDEALPKLQAAAAADPTNADAALALSQVLSGLGRYEDAAKVVDAARKAHPENASLLAAKGRAYFLARLKAESAEEPDGNLIDGLKADSLRWAKEAMKADQKNVEACILMGEIKQKDGDDEQAKSFFEMAVAADGKSFDAVFALADSWFRIAGKDNKNMSLWAKAESGFFEATRLDPKSARAALNYAHCKAWQNEPGKEVALAYFKAAELAPDDEVPLAKAYQRMPKADRTAAFQQLSDAAPKNVRRKIYLAYSLMEDKQFEKAVDVVEQAAKLEPKNGYVPLAEGDIRMAWGKTDDALENYQEALGLFGKDVTADTVKKLGYRLGGITAKTTLSPEQREKLWTVMWKSCPASSGLWSDIGLYYRDIVKPSEPKKAEVWYLRAVEAAPEDATILNDTGVIYDYNLHEPDKGEPYYRKAIAVGKKEGYDWNASSPPGIGFRDSLNNLAKLLIAQKRWKDLKTFAEEDVPQDDPSRDAWIKLAEEKKQ